MNNVVSINQSRVDKMRVLIMGKNIDDETKITLLNLLDLCLHVEVEKLIQHSPD